MYCKKCRCKMLLNEMYIRIEESDIEELIFSCVCGEEESVNEAFEQNYHEIREKYQKDIFELYNSKIKLEDRDISVFVGRNKRRIK